MKLFRQQTKENGGFTLVELMIVIAIIGILAAIAVPNFVRYRQRAYNIVAKSDAANAMRAYHNYHSDVPNTMCPTSTLYNYGFRASEGVTVLLFFSTGPDTPIVRTSHSQGTKYYWANSLGEISTSNM